MARYDFGGTLADFVVTSRRLGGLDVLGLSAATLTFWSAQTGGTRYTDLQLNGSTVSSIAVGTDGQVPKFQGPDGVTEMWADGGSPRVRVVTLQGAPGPVGPQGAASTVPGPTGPTGPQGPQGIPGVNGVANDTATAGQISTPGTATDTALKAAYTQLTSVATTATASATLTANRHTPVDATAAARTMTLPTAPAGALISVEKVDASANAVNVTGTLRGTASSTIALTSQYDARTFLSEGAGSWRPVSDHRTKTSLDATYGSRTGSKPVGQGEQGHDIRYYGAKPSVGADASFDNAQALFDAMTEAKKPGGTGTVIVPGGDYGFLSPVMMEPGVYLIGSGSHDAPSRPGSTFRALPGFVGPAVLYANSATYLHHAGASRLRVNKSPGHGIFVEGGLGEDAVFDLVSCIDNTGDGLRLKGASTPIMLGRFSQARNGGSGIYLDGQSQTHVQIQYLAGDNNGVSLLYINGLDTTGSVRVQGWKSERWNGPTPGHPDVFVIDSGNGGFVDLGQGRVHIGSGVTAGNAILKQTSTSSLARVRIRAALNDASGTGGYTYGYQDTQSGRTLSVAEFIRKELYVREFMSVFDSPTGAGTWAKVAERAVAGATGAGIYIGSGSPEGAVGANPGSLYLREDGTVYAKRTGTSTTGWQIFNAPAQRNATQIQSATDSINTTGKVAGSQVYDTTTSKPLWSSGTSATSTWKDATGTTVYTPV